MGEWESIIFQYYWFGSFYVLYTSHSISQSISNRNKGLLLKLWYAYPFHVSLFLSTSPAFHSRTPLSPKYVGPFSAFMCIFIIQVFYKNEKGTSFQGLAGPSCRPLRCLCMLVVCLQACKRSLWCWACWDLKHTQMFWPRIRISCEMLTLLCLNVCLMTPFICMSLVPFLSFSLTAPNSFTR